MFDIIAFISFLIKPSKIFFNKKKYFRVFSISKILFFSHFISLNLINLYYSTLFNDSIISTFFSEKYVIKFTIIVNAIVIILEYI